MHIENKVLAPPRSLIMREDGNYLGAHLLIDLWGASRLTDPKFMENVLIQCVSACNATLLHIHVHQFTDGGGVSGVAILAESHINVHTWPERNYAAFDVFMCGDANPANAINILDEAFNPKEIEVKEILRGRREEE